jgi:chromosome segregation ATPase
MEEVTVADQSAGEVDVLSSALGDLGFEPEPAKAPKSEASEDDSDLSQDEEDKPESAEDPAEDVSEAEEAEEEQDEEAEDVPREKIQRRIDKLTAARKSAEEKATALAAEAEEAKAKVADYEAQLNEAARPVLSPTADNPLADVDTQDALDAKIKSAQEVRRWALRNTDGATVKRPDGTEVYLDSRPGQRLPHQERRCAHAARAGPPAMARPTPAGA